jgi:hypothetical protein
MKEWVSWEKRWRTVLKAIEELDGDVEPLEILERATNEQIVTVEQKLGMELPECLKTVLMNFSAGVNFTWYLPDDLELPMGMEGISSGTCSWDIDKLVEIEEDRKSWIENCFSNEKDHYDQLWHNKLAFMEVANGDLIAFDLKDYPKKAPVVYLSHDDGEGHGCILGNDFIDFIDKWTLLGCVGPEDWQMTPFIDSPETGLDPDGQNARVWREILGVRFER